MRSQQELLEASGYAARPKDFDDLLRILDSEIRLITPTDPGRVRIRESCFRQATSSSGVRYYQLTHDYLVPSLAGLADPQAEGDAARPGRTAAGGSGGGLERPAGEPPTAVAAAVAQNPLADREEELDAAAAAR